MWLFRELSLPHWAAHALRTGLAILSIAAGVAAIVATSVVANSVLASFERMIAATAGRADVQLTNGGLGVPESLAEEARAVPGVLSVSPFVSGFVSLSGTPGQTLSLYGFDVLGDDEHMSRVPRSTIHVPDEFAFVAEPGAVLFARSFASSQGYDIGSRVEVITPLGAQTLVVRGLVDDVGPIALFGGGVGVMDLAAAQQILAKRDRVDRIDIRLAPGTDETATTAAIRGITYGRAKVHGVVAEGSKARDLLSSLRVVLALAGAIAAVVGFFIIYHTVEVSLAERRADVAVLLAVGVAPSTLLLWLLFEAGVLGAVATAIGITLGLGIAKVSLSLFGGVTAAWVIAPAPHLSITPLALIGAAALGIGTAVVTMLIAARTLFSESAAPVLYTRATVRPARRSFRSGRAIGIGMIATATALLLVAPRSLPHAQLVAFILGVNCLILAGCGLVSPAPALLIGRLGTMFADRLRGIALLLATSRLERNPRSPAAVVTAIVMALGWTLANASLIASFKSSWLGWVHDYYHSDLIVSAGGRVTDILTAPAFSETVTDEIRRLPGVTEAQGLRRVEVDYDESPTLLLSFDRATVSLPVLDRAWSDVASTFWDGGGALVSDTLAHRTGLAPGGALTLNAPAGEVTLPILALFRDVYGADLGAIAISRDRYKALWHDPLIDRIRVWAPHPDDVRQTINERYNQTHGIQAVTYAATMASLVELIEGAFAITYALIFVCLAVSTVGILNFLLTAILDRHREFRTMRAIGMAPHQIASSVSAEGGLIGLTGVIVGLVAGTAVSAVIVLQCVPMVNGWRFAYRFPTSTAVAVSVVACLTAIAVGILPGWMAARPPSVPEQTE